MKIHSAMKGGTSLRATTALILYVRTLGNEPRFEEHEGMDYDEGNELSSTDTAFVSIHEIASDESSQNLEIGPGRCMTHVELEELVASIRTAQAAQRRLLPASVLFADGARLVWHVPSARRPIYFATRDDKFNRRMNAKTVMHPALLFLADAGGMSVWALESDARPTEATKLFIAPYYNLYSSGRMCRGNARYPEGLGVETIPTWEAAFFKTQFTHSNYHGARLTRFEGGHDKLWEEMRKPETFPAQWLEPARKKNTTGALTIQDALNLPVGGEG